jgi:hypothetical protein
MSWHGDLIQRKSGGTILHLSEMAPIRTLAEPRQYVHQNQARRKIGASGLPDPKRLFS